MPLPLDAEIIGIAEKLGQRVEEMVERVGMEAVLERVGLVAVVGRVWLEEMEERLGMVVDEGLDVGEKWTVFTVGPPPFSSSSL